MSTESYRTRGMGAGGMDIRKPPAWKRGIKPLKPGELRRGIGRPPEIPVGKFAEVEGQEPLWTRDEVIEETSTD